MEEIARLTPTFSGVSYEKLDKLGSLQWPCNDDAPEGTPIMHIDSFVRGKGKFMITKYVPTDERSTRRFPLLLTTGRILSQYNVGAQTRRTPNVMWHSEDVLEIHPQDAEDRGVNEGDWVGIQSRSGETVLRATLTDRVQPGVVYTTFHFPESGANVVTTDSSDWATNCPEYKVTAVQVTRVSQPSEWQRQWSRFADIQQKLLRERFRAKAKPRWRGNNPDSRPEPPWTTALPPRRPPRFRGGPGDPRAGRRHRAARRGRPAGRGNASGAGVQRHQPRHHAGHARRPGGLRRRFRCRKASSTAWPTCAASTCCRNATASWCRSRFPAPARRA